MKIIYILLIFVTPLNLFAGDRYPVDPNIDVTNYEFSIYLSDKQDIISGEALIWISHKGNSSEIYLDLMDRGDDGKGMTIEKILVDGSDVVWSHSDGRVKIDLNKIKELGSISKVFVRYKGVPRTGLIISENRYGGRTFFADNWPDRAHNWIPCVDHPSDKAKVEYKVYAPDYYKVVANGTLFEESSLADGMKLTHWKEEVSIPTKVMVIGVARFATQLVQTVDGVDIWTYVFPEDRENGFSDYSIAVEPLIYFNNAIGPYPYEKLANVQSKTMFGGMENAGCIFYSERSVTGKNTVENLMAHEIAHQWFGNSVTEGDWHHVWLSEGFATYFTSCYQEDKYGAERMKSSMLSSRNRVIRAIERDPSPIIDTTITNFMRLLSTYSYQKGAWVLHMLRSEIGDDDFFQGVSNYYNSYRDQTALTSDLRNTIEELVDRDLSDFFFQWLYREDIPVLSYEWEYNGRKKELVIELTQLQEGSLFTFPLDIEIVTGGKVVIERVDISSGNQTIRLKSDSKPEKVNLDPNVKLLYIGAND